MKIQDLYESGNTSVTGVLNTIRAIYANKRIGTSPKLCHAHTAQNIDPASPADVIVLYGFGTTVVHSALLHGGQLVGQYAGVTTSKLLPSGNLQINVNGNIDELEPVYSVSVGDFLENAQ